MIVVNHFRVTAHILLPHLYHAANPTDILNKEKRYNIHVHTIRLTRCFRLTYSQLS